MSSSCKAKRHMHLHELFIHTLINLLLLAVSEWNRDKISRQLELTLGVFLGQGLIHWYWYCTKTPLYNLINWFGEGGFPSYGRSAWTLSDLQSYLINRWLIAKVTANSGLLNWPPSEHSWCLAASNLLLFKSCA